MWEMHGEGSEYLGLLWPLHFVLRNLTSHFERYWHFQWDSMQAYECVRAVFARYFYKCCFPNDFYPQNIQMCVKGAEYEPLYILACYISIGFQSHLCIVSISISIHSTVC